MVSLIVGRIKFSNRVSCCGVGGKGFGGLYEMLKPYYECSG